MGDVFNRLVASGTRFGKDKRESSKPSIKFGLQYAPALHKLSTKMFAMVKEKGPSVKVDKRFGKYLVKTESELYSQKSYDQIHNYFLGCVKFTKESRYNASSDKVGLKEYTTLYYRLVEGLKYYLASIMKEKEPDDPEMAQHRRDESQKKKLTRRVTKYFGGLDLMIVESCLRTDWPNDRDGPATISKHRLLSVLEEFIVESVIGRDRMSPSKLRSVALDLFKHCFPEFKDPDSGLKAVISGWKQEQRQSEEDVKDFNDPWKGKKIKRHYPRPWAAPARSYEQVLRDKINRAIENGVNDTNMSVKELNEELHMVTGGGGGAPWSMRNLSSTKKSRFRGKTKKTNANKRAGGDTHANKRFSTYLIKQDAAKYDEAYLMLPPPFRPGANSTNKWNVAFGRGRRTSSMRRPKSSPIGGVAKKKRSSLFYSPY